MTDLEYYCVVFFPRFSSAILACSSKKCFFINLMFSVNANHYDVRRLHAHTLLIYAVICSYVSSIRPWPFKANYENWLWSCFIYFPFFKKLFRKVLSLTGKNVLSFSTVSYLDSNLTSQLQVINLLPKSGWSLCGTRSHSYIKEHFEN